MSSDLVIAQHNCCAGCDTSQTWWTGSTRHYPSARFLVRPCLAWLFTLCLKSKRKQREDLQLKTPSRSYLNPWIREERRQEDHSRMPSSQTKRSPKRQCCGIVPSLTHS